jgi:putative FmdB family regulatory protein
LPLYPYRCTQCGHRFEKIQRFNDEPETVCPKCGGALERPLTAPGLQFKGAGWYVNDYASKGGSSASETVSADKKPAQESKKETKTEAATSGASGTASASSSTPSAGSSTKKD